MHEMTIVVHVVQTLEDVIEQQHLTRIGKVTLDVGEVSGIIPSFFIECWDLYKTNFPVLKDAKIVLNRIPAITYCSNCGRTYNTKEHGKTCPYCKSNETYLFSGSDCIIKEIEAE